MNSTKELIEDISKGKMAEEYLGKNAHFLELDLSKPSSITQFVNKINSDFSEIDLLYNNAGLIYRILILLSLFERFRIYNDSKESYVISVYRFR